MSCGRLVLVTRPVREAGRWVEALRAYGLNARALPLIDIAPVADSRPIRAVWARIADYQALMFVSAAAVTHFFAYAGGAVAPARHWATGPGTAAALRAAGVADAAIDAPPADAPAFDSEALWALVHAQVRPGTRVLIVRGGEADGHPAGREWLARTIDAAGGQYDTLVSYRRIVPVFDEAQRRLALTAQDAGAAWVFSSSQAIANLAQALPQGRWHAACAVATHERIAQAAQAAGFGRVCVSHASTQAVAASIESLG